MSQPEERTVGILKLDALEYKDKLLQLIKQAGLKIVLEKEMQLSEEQIIALGEQTLKDWMTSQPVYAFILEGPEAIRRWQDVLDPADSEEMQTSVRALYGTDLLRSVYHGSQSEEGAKREVAWLQALMSDDLSNTSSCDPTPVTKPAAKQSKAKSVGSTTKKTTTATTTKPISKTTTPKSATVRPGQNTKQTVQGARTTTGRKPATSTATAAAGSRKSPPSAQSSAGGMSKTRTTRTTAGSELGAERSGVTKTRRSSNATPKSSPGTPRSPPGTPRSPPGTPRSPPGTPRSAPGTKEATFLPPRTTNKTDAAAARRGSVATSAGAKKMSSTGGISKNVPPKSVLTGRTRKYSKVRRDPAEEEKPKEEPIQPKEEETVENSGKPRMESADSCETLSDIEPWNGKETDSEHDAEVAATTAAVCQATTERPSSARASFSPNSVASLPRPETPEIDQLRHRFETMAQVTPVIEKRKSTVSPEIAMRIKEMKPKDPVGERVKSMVVFFMDENLHKWEF
ncbi:NME NM23 member 5 [Apophysomyces ossiformis]|uniref:Nucleoside diphosphate kinase n=1 Tax=Apophysomyces ossiformis TaxID=679940 RepID=A0A8H7EQ87_9FUNG|nr:NME NM23 member 5 [Apophysomyces ossiformis]